MTIRLTIGRFLLVVLWKQASIANFLCHIQWRICRNGWRDLKRPLNEGHPLCGRHGLLLGPSSFVAVVDVAVMVCGRRGIEP